MSGLGSIHRPSLSFSLFNKKPPTDPNHPPSPTNKQEASTAATSTIQQHRGSILTNILITITGHKPGPPINSSNNNGDCSLPSLIAVRSNSPTHGSPTIHLPTLATSMPTAEKPKEGRSEGEIVNNKGWEEREGQVKGMGKSEVGHIWMCV